MVNWPLQKLFQSSFKLVQVFRLAFPNDEHAPPQVFELANCFSISLLIAGEFRLPVLQPRARQTPIKATIVRMLVPEATVHEYRFPPSDKNQVRFAGQILAVEAEAVSQPVRQSANDNFWLGITRFDCTHICGACVARYFIHQVARSNGKSAISRRRRPSIIMSRSSAESVYFVAATASRSSFSAIW